MKLNCDLGESKGNWLNGNDQSLLKLVNMVNISCGAHAGDEELIKSTIVQAIAYGKELGAHPSYPDRENFGRLSLEISFQDLYDCIYSQLSHFLIWSQGHIDYVKPHGALYHDCMTNYKVLDTLIKVMEALKLSVPIMLMAGFESNYPIISEAFLDRKYLNGKRLVPRSQANSVISEPKEVLEQYKHIVNKKSIKGIDGEWYKLNAESLCIHSDTPNAVTIAQEILKYKRNKTN